MFGQHQPIKSAWVAIFAAALGASLAAACGESGTAEAGFEASGGNDGEEGEGGSSGSAGKGGKGSGSELASAWPTADPSTGPTATGAPTFEPPTPPAPKTCENRKGPKGERIITVPHGGLLRTALLHVPEGYDPAKGAMLILNFHGFSSDGLQEAVLTRMNKASDEKGFVVAYPYGVVNSWNAGKCCGTAWLDAVDDVGFVQKLLDQLEADYCVDPRRIYSTGMSNGGFISHRLGCELSDRIAAIAPVAGVIGIPSCKPSRPVPVLHFHGTEDPLVPYGGGNPVLNVGLQGELYFPSVADTMAGWRERNGCSDKSTTIYEEGDAICLRWNECQNQSEVILCTLKGGGHTWPGGVPIPFLGKTSDSISATETMIKFFEAHPMP